MVQKFVVWNHIEEYYIVSFAIDYAKFHIYCKDCDVETIDWEKIFPDVINGKVMDSPLPHDYNVNLVLKFLDMYTQSK